MIYVIQCLCFREAAIPFYPLFMVWALTELYVPFQSALLHLYIIIIQASIHCRDSEWQSGRGKQIPK
jgi:hypothetical protein